MEKRVWFAFASAIEPLRAANRICGNNIYKWKILSTDGELKVRAVVEVDETGCKSWSEEVTSEIKSGADVPTVTAIELCEGESLTLKVDNPIVQFH